MELNVLDNSHLLDDVKLNALDQTVDLFREILWSSVNKYFHLFRKVFVIIVD